MHCNSLLESMPTKIIQNLEFVNSFDLSSLTFFPFGFFIFAIWVRCKPVGPRRWKGADGSRSLCASSTHAKNPAWDPSAENWGGDLYLNMGPEIQDWVPARPGDNRRPQPRRPARDRRRMALPGRAAHAAGSQQRVATLQPCPGNQGQTRSDDPELASREALHASSSFACSFLVFPLGLLWRQQGPFPPERCPRHFSALCMRGQESKNMIPVRTRLPYHRCLATSSAATFFGPSQARNPCLSLALFHPSRDFRASWHQVLWVTGAWIYCGCSRWPPHLLQFLQQHVEIAGLSRSASLRVQPHWSCWSCWIPVREKPLVILIVEVMLRPHQVEAVDPTQPVGASVKTGCYPVSGRVDDAPVALAERGAPSLGFAGSDPANGFFFAFHRSLLMTSIVRGDTHIASAICRSDKPALRYFVRRFSSRPFELARIALTSSAPSISIIFGDPFSMTLLHLLSRPVGRMS